MANHDPLLAYRDEFPALARPGIYFVSHSLGAMPRAVEQHFAEYRRLWVEEGINAWHEWMPEVDRAAARVGKIIGAPDGTMTMATNVSQIQALIASCLDYRARPKVVLSSLEFPSVSYVWHEERRRGAQVEVVGSVDGGIHLDLDRFLAAIDERTAIVPISHVLFRSSTITPVRAIVERAKSVGALVLLDCYQSTGTVPFSVMDLDVDMACGGSVKWLCGGPGAGYLYVRRDRIPQLTPRNTGWFGHEAPFAFTMPEQRFAKDIHRFSAGTLGIAALYQARAGAELIAEVGVEAIRAKSLRMTSRIIALCDERGYELRSPREANERGGTVCFEFPNSAAITEQLCKTGFLCDHRPGAGLRISPHFYSTDDELERFMDEVQRLAR